MVKQEGGAVVVYPEGRIDSTNAREFEREVLGALERSCDGQVIFDFDHLDYISSAGLRVLLVAANRMAGQPLVRNVSPAVYDILDMTGFTSLLNAERKLRSIDIAGCQVIGHGGTSTVYRIDRDTIVKVYAIPNALEEIKREQWCAKKALLKGIPTAISYDAVRVGDHYGSVFELVNARTFVDLLAGAPERTDELIRMHVEVIRQLHDTLAQPGELPDCRDIYFRYLAELGDVLPPALRDRVASLLRAMPVDLHLIHGDIHMGNVMLCDGEPLLIDMATLCTGNPVFDLGDLFIAYQAFNADDPGNSMRVLGIEKRTCDEVWEKTLACYLDLPDAASMLRATQRIKAVGYVRFLYLVAVQRLGGESLIDARIQNAVARLSALLDAVDSFLI